jgi:mRNA-degrading endonuclease RelE of RelBE toxin-antitoxin system
VLEEDVDEVGHAALALARTACEKKLAVDPEGYGAALHSPLHGLFKLKASHVRIAYHVETAAREVWVLMIGDRRDIWDQDQPEILDRLADERVRHDAEQEEHARVAAAEKAKRPGARGRGRPHPR